MIIISNNYSKCIICIMYFIFIFTKLAILRQKSINKKINNKNIEILRHIKYFNGFVGIFFSKNVIFIIIIGVYFYFIKIVE